MCHIPVFCWISATVLHNILEQKINNDVKFSQAGDDSKTLQESNTEDTPKTLTQMYSHFLRFRSSRAEESMMENTHQMFPGIRCHPFTGETGISSAAKKQCDLL